jgi:hypothetical protein
MGGEPRRQGTMLQLYGIATLLDRSTDECVCELFLNYKEDVSKEIQGEVYRNRFR